MTNMTSATGSRLRRLNFKKENLETPAADLDKNQALASQKKPTRIESGPLLGTASISEIAEAIDVSYLTQPQSARDDEDRIRGIGKCWQEN
jgi:hypothetical protein